MDDDDSKNRDGLVASTETPTATPIADAAGGRPPSGVPQQVARRDLWQRQVGDG